MLGDKNDVEIVAPAADEGDAEEKEEEKEEEARQIQPEIAPVVEADQDDDEEADVEAGEDDDTEENAEEEGAPGRPRMPLSLYYSYILVVGVLFAAVVALAVVVIVDNDTEDAGLDTEDAGLDTLVEGENLAQVPVALVEYLKDVVALPKGADGKRRLALPPDMLERLGGKCATLDQYSPSKNTMKWQCDQSDENHIYPLDEDDESYQPTKATLELFAAATGASLSSLRSMIIGSGLPSASAPKGSWCGMPAAGNMIGVHGGANRSGQQELAYQYW
jgi:hypothetical protein